MMLDLHLLDCLQMPEKGRSGVSLIQALRSCGATFLNTNYGFEEERPEKIISAQGNTRIPTGVEHPVLAKGCYHSQKTRAPIRKHGTGSFYYIHARRHFALGQDLKVKDHAHWDEIAQGQLAFARMLYPHTRPRFGWIDGFGSIESREVLDECKPLVLFWANVFGPEIVKHLDMDFLIKAPGWKKEELDDGGILYVVTSKYQDWYARPSIDALRYLQAKVPQMRLYRAKSVELLDEVSRMVVTDEKSGKETVVYDRSRKRKGKSGSSG